jgi:signal transduction histidine kinase
MGGIMEVESQRGVGTTFTLHLPGSDAGQSQCEPKES